MTINNNNIFGAFTLNEARGSRLTGDWLNKEFVANYGWFGGGAAYPSLFSTVDRIDFSNDSVSASVRGPLSLARYGLAATGNSNYGWFGGGSVPVPLLAPFIYLSTVDRIDFSNDSSTASVRGPLSLARYYLAATGNSNYGWFGGGIIDPYPSKLSTVDRIDFSNDFSTASPRGPLSLARSNSIATGNSNYGWFGGGWISGTVSTVDRIDFSNDSSTASVRGPLGQAITSTATGNSNYGWFGGGWIPGPGPVSTVNRIDFSNDSATASPRGPLSSVRQDSAATGNSNYGWFGGGYTPAVVSTVDRIDFTNDTSTASPRGPLVSTKALMAATSGVLNIRRQKSGNYGWFGGGYAPGPPGNSRSRVDRIDFSNDSPTASPRGSLSSARYIVTATGNSNYGYFGGGMIYPSIYYSTVDRIDFSNDSANALVKGVLFSTKIYSAATGNSNYGWFGGGYPTIFPGVNVSRVDRIDFSNDSAKASVRGPLPSSNSELAATGNSNYGWFSGFGRVDRIDFSNDNATASPRGSSSFRYNLAATGNSNYGWFGGGSPGPLSTVDRIDFSNDNITASPRGTLSLARNQLAATGNSNYGWFGGGGAYPSLFSTVDRINFSNDSVSASPRGPLSLARSNLAATSNTTR